MKDDRFREAREMDRIEEFREILQFILLLMIPVYMMFWLLDVIFAPHLKWIFLGMRLPMIPIALLCYHMTKKSHELKTLQLLGLVLALYAGSTVSIMALMTGGVFSLYYAGLNMVGIGCLSFFPWTVAFKIYGILAIYGTFYIGCLISGLDAAGWHHLVIISWFMIGTIIFSLIIRFFHDLYRGKEIKARLALHDEQKKLEKANCLIREFNSWTTCSGFSCSEIDVNPRKSVIMIVARRRSPPNVRPSGDSRMLLTTSSER